MRHPVYKVKGVEVVGPYRLRIEFTDGLVRTIDLGSILEGGRPVMPTVSR